MSLADSRTGKTEPHPQPPSTSGSRGFSLIELMVVVAIMLVIAAFSVPTLVTTLDAFRMRGALSSAGNMAQRCRTTAVKKDLTQRLHLATVNNRAVMFVTNSNDAAVAPVVGDPALSAQFWFPQQFVLAAGPPAGAGAPPPLTGVTMWGTNLVPNVNPQDPYFNSRGMPCLPDPLTGVCNPTTGFVYYYRYQSSRNVVRWTATSISPAGRIQSWFWTGASWGN